MKSRDEILVNKLKLHRPSYMSVMPNVYKEAIHQAMDEYLIKNMKKLIKEIKSVNGWGSHYMLPISFAERIIKQAQFSEPKLNKERECGKGG